MELTKLDYIWFAWFGVSVYLFGRWAAATRFGTEPLRQVEQPRYSIRGGDLAAVLIVFFGSLLLASAFGPLPGDIPPEHGPSAANGQADPNHPAKPPLNHAGQDKFYRKLNLSTMIGIAAQGFTVLLALGLARARFENALQGFGLEGQDWGKTLAYAAKYFFVGAALAILTLALTLIISSAVGHQEVQRHVVLQELAQNPPRLTALLMVIFAGIIAPVTEEIIFRGWLQNYLIGVFLRRQGITAEELALAELRQPADAGMLSLDAELMRQQLTQLTLRARIAGILITALIFAVIHGAWQQMPALFVLAVVLGYSYVRHRNLWIPILIHAWFNLMFLGLTLAGAK